MKNLCLILIAFAIPGNFTSKYLTDKMNNHPLSYLALGDSYTIGEAVPTEQSYPVVLADELNNHKITVNKPTIIATTGWTTDELIDAITQSDITNKRFDFVSLLIGVNDQYRGLSQDNYKIKFQQVLHTAIHFAGGNKNHVFVLSIPDWGVTPFAAGQENIIGPQIDQFNAINKQISLVAGVNYLDITPISRRAANEPDLIASDGLHPSGKMYAEWVDMLEPMVLKKLN